MEKTSLDINAKNVIIGLVLLFAVLTIVNILEIDLGNVYVVDAEKQKSIYMTLAQIDGTLLGIIITGYGFIETHRMQNLHSSNYKKQVGINNFWIFLFIVLTGIVTIISFIWCVAMVEDCYDKLFDFISNEAMIFFLLFLVSLIIYVYFMSPYYFEKIMNEDIEYLLKENEDRKTEKEEFRKDMGESKDFHHYKSEKEYYIEKYEELELNIRKLSFFYMIFGDVNRTEIERLPINMILKSLEEKKVINNYCYYMFDGMKIYYDILKESNTFNLVRNDQVVDMENLNHFINKIIDGERVILDLLNKYCLENALKGLDEEIVANIGESGKTINEIYNHFKDKEKRRIDRTLNKLIKFRIIKKMNQIYLLND